MSLRAWRVRRGVKFLDKHVGRDLWIQRIDVNDIHTGNTSYCPLAQATEERFWIAARAFGFSNTYVSGFRLALLGFMNWPDEAWESLDVAWREEIMKIKTRELVDW